MSEKEYTYRTGALLIGSLLWSNKSNRENWRKETFGAKLDKTKVQVPIRYGRYSTTWHSPTMVFSHEFYQEGKSGQAYAVSFNKHTMVIDEIIEQAKAMSKAEGSDDDKLIKGKEKWGVIIYWLNPSINQDKKQHFIDHWQAKYPETITQDLQDRFKMHSEVATVFDSTGMLQFDWPEELEKFDVLITTQTQPRSSKTEKSGYLSTQDIANQFYKKPEYFLRNILHDITTIQDREIIECLKKMDQSPFLQNCLDQHLPIEAVQKVYPELSNQDYEH